MATTWYHTVNGEIIGETTSGSRNSYVTDGLGSVTATQNAVGATTATFRFKPYGALLVKTGAGQDPAFLWNGALGYRSHLAALHGDSYMRQRSYSSRLGAWLEVDLLWPDEPPYLVVSANPCTYSDPSGLTEKYGCTLINGPAPPDGDPPKDPKDQPYGFSACNKHPGGGNVFSWICTKKPWRPCTVIHEEQRRKDLGPCCKKLISCYKPYLDKAGIITDMAGINRCVDHYQNWLASVKRIADCRAYTRSLKCGQALFKEKGCDKTPNTPTCKDLTFYIANSRMGIKNHCTGLPSPWNKDLWAKLAECPYKFTSDTHAGG